MTDVDPDHVIETWFALPNKNEADDELVEKRLGPHYRRARNGEYEEWQSTPEGRLALILLFDQVPRHLFRNDPEQYATDDRARRLATKFFEEGFPDYFTAPEVFYAALPYLHAEDLQKQKTVNPIIHDCADQLEELHFMGEVADDYLETIRRFGRFPHRNEILGRRSTPAEEAWLEAN